MKSYRTEFWLAFLTLALAGSAPAQTPAQAPARPPNVIFIVCDDLWTGLGCYGNTALYDDSQIKTPNIDKLAASGMRFDRAYCQYSVCNPSRSSFLTGKRPDYLGIYDNTRKDTFRIKFPDIVTLPQYFRQNGYFTASLGKIVHCGVDAAGKPTDYLDPKSFEVNEDFKPTQLGNKGEGRVIAPKMGWCRWLAADGTDDDQPDGQAASAAINLLQTHKDKPFFICLGLHKPHDPFNAPKKYFDQYPLDQIQLAHDPADATPDNPLEFSTGWKADMDAFTDQDRREFRRAYFACTSFTDAQAGRVLDALAQSGVANNTIVVLIGDNGYQMGEHGWWNKNTDFELSARVPLIMQVPGAKGMGRSTLGLVEFVDLYPTLVDLAGLPQPAGLEGQSFRKLLDNPTLPGKSSAFTQVYHEKVMGRSVRTAQWRYTEWGNGGAQGVELYDQEKDMGEFHNLAGKPEYASISADLKKVLEAGAKEASSSPTVPGVRDITSLDPNDPDP